MSQGVEQSRIERFANAQERAQWARQTAAKPVKQTVRAQFCKHGFEKQGESNTTAVPMTQTMKDACVLAIRNWQWSLLLLRTLASSRLFSFQITAQSRGNTVFLQHAGGGLFKKHSLATPPKKLRYETEDSGWENMDAQWIHQMPST
eukprot:504208-Amphidinium_carterae.2